MFKNVHLVQSTSTEAAAAVQRIALRALTTDEREEFSKLAAKLIREFNNISQGGVDPHLSKLQGAIELGIVDPSKIAEVKSKIAELQISQISSASISKAGHQVAQLAALSCRSYGGKPATYQRAKKTNCLERNLPTWDTAKKPKPASNPKGTGNCAFFLINFK